VGFVVDRLTIRQGFLSVLELCVSINCTYISSFCRWTLLILAISSCGSIIFHRDLVEILDLV